jgi:sterol 24-C-methyltransferase
MSDTHSEEGGAGLRGMREALDDYLEMRQLDGRADPERKLREQPRLVSRYYDVVTRFYELAWGPSFHFSARRRGESLRESQLRQERDLAERLRLGPGMRVADVGCGVGGPMIEIARTTGASIVGLNVNAYQISSGRRRVAKAGLTKLCSFQLANFMEVPLPQGHFDAIYSFEAICHAPDTIVAFRELHRLLRPGGELAVIDWCLTERFDEDDLKHRDVRDRIEHANGTPDLLRTQAQLEAVKQAGFEILSATDQAVQSDPETPWYLALQGRDISLASIARVPVGRRITAAVTRALEAIRVAPAGTAEAAELLNVAADSLVEGGEVGIFTPMFLVHARKPA